MRLRAVLVAAATVLSACSGAVAATSTTSSPPAPPATTQSPTTTASVTTTSPTTTVAPSTTPPNNPTVVGVVGCSMSRNSIDGYESLGGTNMWPSPASYSGGSIGRWVSDLTQGGAGYWEWFDRQLVEHPDTTVLWWNLCTFKAAASDSFEQAQLVLQEIVARAPGVEIYVSAQPSYAEGHLCEIAGATGPAAMEAVAEQLVAAGLAKAGPVMGPLLGSDTSDGCHADGSGEELLGRQLLEFFG